MENFIRDLKIKTLMAEDYGTPVEDVFDKCVEDMTEHYRAKLFMLKKQQDAEYKKFQEELEVWRIQGKLELINDLFNNDALKEEKEKLESALVLAQAKASDVYVPKIDWFVLNEPQMFRP
ncbi:ATP-dependent DNA helicase [Raphanus sativus]|nr:ATP-dependent DNA helicase [Raphanus sativus]